MHKPKFDSSIFTGFTGEQFPYPAPYIKVYVNPGQGSSQFVIACNDSGKLVSNG